MEAECQNCEDKKQQAETTARLLSSLQSENKAAKRRTLQDLIKQAPEKFGGASKEDALHFTKAVSKLFFDSSEKCRELAISFVSIVLGLVQDGDPHLTPLVPVLVARLGQPELVEPSEELRLDLVNLILAILERFKAKVAPYLGDMVLILQRTVVDPYPEVKKVSARCVGTLAEGCPQAFYYQGEGLVKPLVQGMSHQHSKVRMACLKALGSAIKHINNSALDPALPMLAQKTYDGNHDVRRTLIAVTGDWLLTLVDRYSYQWKLLPILLCCLSDEAEDLRRAVWDIWDKVGGKYEQENEQELKDKMDFADVVSVAKGLEFGRPRLGCRVIAQINFHKILPPLLRDMSDWALNSRLKASQLLYHLLYHIEDHTTQSLRPLMQGLYSRCSDEEVNIVDISARCCRLVGHYVPAEVWADLVLPAVLTSSGGARGGGGVGSSVAVGPLQCTGCVRCLAGLLQGTPLRELATGLKPILKCLNEPELCQTSHQTILVAVLSCVKNILNTNVSLDRQDIHHLFLVLLRLSPAFGGAAEWKAKVQDSLSTLAELSGHGQVVELYKEYGKDVLQPMIGSCDSWTLETPACSVFTSFVQDGGWAVVQFAGDLVPVFCTALKPDSNVELQLHFIVLLIEFLHSVKEKEKAEFSPHSKAIVRDILTPNLVWKAGRTAAALRTSMLACLLTLLESGLLCASGLEDLTGSLSPPVLSCLDDATESTRKMATQVLPYLVPRMDVDGLHGIYNDLLKRLDDSVEEIRLLMAQTLLVYFRSFPKEYDSAFYKAHCDVLYSSLLIHLDDSNEKIQDPVLAVLKEASRLHKELLKEKVQSVQCKHRSPKYCDDLLKHISSSE